MSAQRFEQNGRNTASAGLPQIGQAIAAPFLPFEVPALDVLMPRMRAIWGAWELNKIGISRR
jgi:hypothetical protein